MERFFTDEIILENQRVKLVPFSMEYKDELRKIIFDKDIHFTVACRSEDDLHTYMLHTISERQAGRAYPFIIIDKATNEVAGSTRFGNVVPHNKRLEIGWTWYGKTSRGTGLNKACKYELLKFAFEELTYRRVQFSTDIENYQSQKAILKLGAKQEGIFRDNYIDSWGRSRDDVYFSILQSEWYDIKRNVFREFV